MFTWKRGAIMCGAAALVTAVAIAVTTPTKEADGSKKPSWLALKLATSDKTDYTEVDHPRAPIKGTRSKILVLFTEHKNMKMKNGEEFSTGNHPVEALLPMLHLQRAGFDFEIATPTGKPVIFEMWAFPREDKNVVSIHETLKPKFDAPLTLDHALQQAAAKADEYAAVFVPGGHGAMLGIPEDPKVGEMLRWANDNKNIFTITLCHGPGALLATTLAGGEFLYKGYKMAVFPDSVDEITPTIGYLPGPMPWKLQEKLMGLGATVVNSDGDDTVVVDRRLITGASPKASNKLGLQAVQTLLADLN